MGLQDNVRTRMTHFRGRLHRKLPPQPNGLAPDLQPQTSDADLQPQTFDADFQPQTSDAPPQPETPDVPPTQAAAISTEAEVEAQVTSDREIENPTKERARDKLKARYHEWKSRRTTGSISELGTSIILVTIVAAAGFVVAHQLPRIHSLFQWKITPGWLVSLLTITLLLALIGTVEIYHKKGRIDQLVITVFYIALGTWILTLMVKPA